jgi:hypothetical protein
MLLRVVDDGYGFMHLEAFFAWVDLGWRRLAGVIMAFS